MKHVDYGAGGAPEVLKIVEGPVPQPGPVDVLIHVAYAGVNGPDLAQRKGRYPPPPGASPLIGLECAGNVAAVGSNVTQWKPGDDVCALVFHDVVPPFFRCQLLFHVRKIALV